MRLRKKVVFLWVNKERMRPGGVPPRDVALYARGSLRTEWALWAYGDPTKQHPCIECFDNG